MDEAEGFFPERRLLAYRRSLRSAEPVPPSTAGQSGSVWGTWWILLLCMGPSYIPMWVSISPRHTSTGSLLPILIFLACALIFAVFGIAVGIYRGLRTEKLFTPE